MYPTRMDSRATGIPKRLLSAAMRMSAAMDSSHPPPTQKPLIIQMVGLDMASMVSIAPSNASAYTLALAESFRYDSKSLMSAPAENAASPAPVNTTTFTLGSPSRSRAMRRSSCQQW